MFKQLKGKVAKYKAQLLLPLVGATGAVAGQLKKRYRSLAPKKQKAVKLSFFAAAAVMVPWVGVSLYQAQFVKLYGNVDIRSVNVSFRVSGRINNVYVEEGQTVKKGDSIASIDAEPYRLALLQAKANYDSAKARNALILSGYRPEDIEQASANLAARQAAFNESKLFYQRQHKLYKSKATNEQALDGAQSKLEQAQASLNQAKAQYKAMADGFRIEEIEDSNGQLRSSEAAVAISQLRLDDTVVRSPSDGIVLTRILEPGSLVGAGSPVITVQLQKPVWVRAYVSETQLGYTTIGKEVWVENDSGFSYKGVIGFVSSQSEFTPKSVETPDFRTSLVYRLRIVIEQADSHLLQGMPVTIRFKK